jgi:hypothetical protein
MEERRRHKKELLRQGLDPDAPENQRTLKDIFDSTVTKVGNSFHCLLIGFYYTSVFI